METLRSRHANIKHKHIFISPATWLFTAPPPLSRTGRRLLPDIFSQRRTAWDSGGRREARQQTSGREEGRVVRPALKMTGCRPDPANPKLPSLPLKMLRVHRRILEGFLCKTYRVFAVLLLTATSTS